MARIERTSKRASKTIRARPIANIAPIALTKWLEPNLSMPFCSSAALVYCSSSFPKIKWYGMNSSKARFFSCRRKIRALPGKVISHIYMKMRNYSKFIKFQRYLSPR